VSVVLEKPHPPARRSSFFNDPIIRGRIYQSGVIVALVLFFLWIGHNTASNLARQNKMTGFDFFFWKSGFDIFFTLIPYSRASYYWEAFLVGLLNTLLVSVLGIIFATLLGFIIGIARLSSNWIISRLATVYIETLRNIPLLLVLFFWYFAVLKAMPSVRESIVLFGSVAINNRGINIPKPMFEGPFYLVVIGFFIAVAGVIVLRKWSVRRMEKTGQRFPFLVTALMILVCVPGVVWLVSGTNVDLDIPHLSGFNYRGGVSLPPEFAALLFGLVVYTASFIAEVVRAGIQSVDRGQMEAAQALGLKSNDRLRFVVIPQAMRVIIPPMTNQYLNLTKNSSLAAAIGYPELISVFMGTTLNQTGRAIEVVFLTMLVYLTLALSTSALMNWYNRRVALVER
jgi:general L-amino acid transport system permease protein